MKESLQSTDPGTREVVCRARHEALFDFGKVPLKGGKSDETIGPGEARLAYFDDTNITS